MQSQKKAFKQSPSLSNNLRILDKSLICMDYSLLLLCARSEVLTSNLFHSPGTPVVKHRLHGVCKDGEELLWDPVYCLSRHRLSNHQDKVIFALCQFSIFLCTANSPAQSFSVTGGSPALGSVVGTSVRAKYK